MKSKEPAKVFIVEDDLLLSMVEERLIKKLGYEVIGKADEGGDAVSQISELNPDVVVMDISLKGDIDGVETMRKVREKSDVPVIYLSGSGDRYNYERAKKTGFIDYLTKPVTSKDLEEPLKMAVRQNGSKSSSNNSGSESPSRDFNKTA